jgi:two-component system KDP operon response regulator KdpE
LDLGLPDLAGVEVLKQLRKWNSVPVIILSAFGQEGSKVAGLDAGADDYLTKPFGDGELLARLRAQLRRIKPALATNTFSFGAIEIDFALRRVMKSQRPVKLTSKEYALLKLFITHRDKALTHRQILREVWGPKAEEQTHYLRTYLLRLRRKLEDDLDAPRFFQTESGIGYRFVSAPLEVDLSPNH